MCSILGILNLDPGASVDRPRALHLSSLQRHRGPDWSGTFQEAGVMLVHERLAVVDPASGAQPLYGTDDNTVLAVNGEIYNHKELAEGLEQPFDFRTESDCEVLLPLYEQRDAAFVSQLNGIFAFVLYDRERNRTLVARDPMGVVPLYMGWDEEGTLFVASEMKALVPVCKTVKEFPPGHLLDSEVGELKSFWDPQWTDYDHVKDSAVTPGEVGAALSAAVRRQMMSDVPYGVLLSGGLDSSIISAIAARQAPLRVEDDDKSPAWWPRLHSFSIGLEGSPDLAAAQEVATHLGTVHHSFHFTIQEGIDALRDVIYHLETYDVTTVRASTPMYLMARRIRAMGVKMVLSGEGADEIFGGYLYFHHAPNARAFHEETVRKLARLHSYDCLRANKSMAAWGVEARVPFLDLEFLETAMMLDPVHKLISKGRIEKQVLRDEFADLLPESVVRRQKEQFSDGVGYGWIDGLKDHAERTVRDSELADASHRFPHNPPKTKEAFLYRSIFEDHFPLGSAAACVPGGDSVACSTPEALAWTPELVGSADPSGRAVRGVHEDAY